MRRAWSERQREVYMAGRRRRFWSRIDQSDSPRACWLWKGPRMWNVREWRARKRAARNA